MTETREGYDLWADTYDAADNPLVAMASLARERLARSVAGARVLELGCGTGRNRAFFLDAGATEYAGVDASPGMLARARALPPDARCRWIEADVTRPLPDDLRDFDLVVFSLVLEHVKEVAPVFGHAAAAVREGGRMVIHELHADLRAEGTRAHFRAGDREHVLPSHAHEVRAYEAALAASGWRMERATPWVATEATCRASAKLAKHLGKPVLVEVEARRVRDYRTIYAQHAGAYEALVAREDHEGNLLAALRAIAPLAGAEVVETGAGTGRVSFLLAPHVRSVAAFDREPAMLAVAEARRCERGVTNVRFAQATHGALPVEGATADLAIEGWAFGHAVGWNPAGWLAEVNAYVAELRRVLRPGGTLVLVETMGTGVERPFEGGHALEPLHAHLVDRLGFAHRCVRTDYAFGGVEEAAATTGFFFGERMAERVRTKGWRIVPEHTGVYWLRA